MMTVWGQFHCLQQLCDLCINTRSMESLAPDKYFDLKTSGFILKKKKQPVGGTFESREEILKGSRIFH